ncbi:MAG: hypothetical protein WC455_18225 [Dehalococcoidia bacterium]|jgi:hypothetical protein
MFVRLNCNQNIVSKGVMHQYKKGDWVDVGRQWAQQWIAAGIATMLDTTSIDGKPLEPTAGILVRGSISHEMREQITKATNLQWAFVGDSGLIGWLPFTETLIYQATFMLRLDLLITGFNLLKKWQVAIPLWDYETLAANVGTELDREATKAVIRDLRVPLRDTRLIFVRRCGDTRRLLELWREGCAPENDERLAWMRAMYTVKPLVCDLPASWTGRG